ncbi:hypothetical protein ACFOWT_04890 [Croceibacterium xixiisoli]
MLEQKRVDDHAASLCSLAAGEQSREDVAHYIGKVDRYMRGDAPNAIGAGQAFSAIGIDLRFTLQCAASDKTLTTAYRASVLLMMSDLVVKKRGTGVKIGSNYNMSLVLGMLVPTWQAAGWIDHAAFFARDIWTGYREESSANLDVKFGNPNPGAWVNEHSNPYLVQKPAWFTTMTTVDLDLWRRHGYDPDADSLGPYWMLAQVWDDPDPAKVRNALQAVRDMNLGTTFIKDEPMGKRVYIVDDFLLLNDYDIRSVNMRRIALGLSPVHVESYLDGPMPNEVLPFTQDDVFWPAYLKMCGEIGAQPIAPADVVAVALDPETLRVEKA